MIHLTNGVILLLFLRIVHGWGPYTHAGFGTLHLQQLQACSVSEYSEPYLRGGKNNIKANTSIENLEGVFVVSNYFPDAFKKSRPWMHSFDYAAFQLEQASKWNTTSNRWSNVVEFLRTDAIKAFSYGYLLHLVQDYVGHHNNTGYLNPLHDHPLEFDVDTFLYDAHKNVGPPWYYSNHGMALLENDPKLRHIIATFVANTTQQYANIHGRTQEGGLSVGSVETTIQRYSYMIRAESWAMLLHPYKKGLVQYDVCHASDYQQALHTLDKAMNWAMDAVATLNTILFPWNDRSPAQASQEACLWVDRKFRRDSLCEKKNGNTINTSPYKMLYENGAC